LTNPLPIQRLKGFKIGEKPFPLVYQFEDETGAGMVISGYTVKFYVRERDGSSASLLSGALAGPPPGVQDVNGWVQYVWQGTEFTTPGHYLAEFWIGNLTNRWASDTIEFPVGAPVGPAPSI
jgi:hypothetical protein